MSEQDDKLIKTTKLGSTSLGFGLKGKLQQASQKNQLLDDVSKAKDRIVIVADDSGSMAGEAYAQQKKAIEAFLGVCNPLDTAVGITPMNGKQLNLTMLHSVLLIQVLAWDGKDLGGTPMFEGLQKAFQQNPTRTVLISDGQPTDGHAFELKENSRMFVSDYFDAAGKLDLANWKPNKTLVFYKEKEIKIDTVYIGTGESKELKAIAEFTGGMYIVFKEGETFAKSFKYLAPAYYAMLTSGQIKV